MTSDLERYRLEALTIPAKYMSRDMTKLTMWLCVQRRLRSAWASAKSDQSLRCPYEGSLGPELPNERTAKTLIRLDGCPGWSESSLGAHSFCWFWHVAAHIAFCMSILANILGQELNILVILLAFSQHTGEQPQANYDLIDILANSLSYGLYLLVSSLTIDLSIIRYGKNDMAICLIYKLCIWRAASVKRNLYRLHLLVSSLSFDLMT